MTEMLRRLWALCLLRAGPQDLPYSPALTQQLVLLSVLVDVLYAQMLMLDAWGARVLLSLLELLLVPWLLLSLRQRIERYAQTLAALAGSGVMFSLMLLPLAMLASDAPPADSAEQIGATPMMLAWLVLGLYGWVMLVRAHILRFALDLPRLPAALLAIAWLIFDIALGAWLFGSNA